MTRTSASTANGRSFCLTVGQSRVRLAACHELRVAIAGTGFIGAVHARSARLAGARLVGVAASTPERARRGRGERSAPSAPSTRPRSWSRDAGRRRRPHLHAQPPARAARRGRARRRQARDLREAARARRRRRAAARRRRRASRAACAAVPFVYRYYPTVREARERVAQRADRRRSACSTAPTCRTGCCAPTTTTGASTTSSAAPRARSPTSARTGATSPSSSPATASRGSARARSPRCPSAPSEPHARVRAGDGDGEPRAVDDRGRGDRPVRDRRRRARLRRHQPDLGRPQEPALARDRRRRRGARVRPGGPGGAVVSGAARR